MTDTFFTNFNPSKLLSITLKWLMLVVLFLGNNGVYAQIEFRCAADKVIFCDEDYEDLSLTGKATIAEGNSEIEITYKDFEKKSACGRVVAIERKWTATDALSKTTSCIQRITIENDEPFYINAQNSDDQNDDVIWTPNYTTNDCSAKLTPDNLPAPYNRPTIMEDVCDFVSVTYEDEILAPLNGECNRILRKWRVIDWCQFSQKENKNTTHSGVWYYTQVIKVVATDAPSIQNDFSNTDAFYLYQNIPNPVQDETMIGFYLPDNSRVQLQIYDAAGRVLKTIHENFTKGYHEIRVNRADLQGKEILFYQLKTNENEATRKMILVNQQ